MRRLLATLLIAGAGLAAPAWAFAQVAEVPVIQALPPATPARHTPAHAPIWQHAGTSVSVRADSHARSVVPTGTAAGDARAKSAGARLHLITRPGITAHAGLREIRWMPAVLPCGAARTGVTCLDAPVDDVRHGEVGAGYSGLGVKLDVSLGQTHSNSTASTKRTLLPRVLPVTGGADVAAPLWFRNSTATDLSARGRLQVAQDTSVNLGASLGRVRFLPDSGLPGNDTLDQTTLSLGVQRGGVRGAIVGRILEPNLPGAALDRDRRWSGIDLGISVRLPWRGELNFGAQNVWTSGSAPLLFGAGGTAPDQGRVPYVQYHQDL